jgi:cyanophycinase
MRTFLIGGGRDSVAAHRPFVEAAGGPLLAYVLDQGEETDPDRWSRQLAAAGAPATSVVVVSPDRPPHPGDLAGVTGVYVAGGLSPGYRDVLAGADRSWLVAARAAGLPYGGFSAGAAIAPTHALVGGWRASYRGHDVAVCDEDFGEGLTAVTVLPGLGLVPFLVEVHAAQWGTHYRLLHALAAAGLDEGWALDEDTTVEVTEGVATVHGTGTAARLRRHGDRTELTVLLPGDTVPLG